MRKLAAAAFAVALLAGCSGGSSSAPPPTVAPTSTSTLPAGINPKLTLGIAKAREARVRALAAISADPGSLAESKSQALARANVIGVYREFIAGHAWPPSLQGDADAVVNAWTRVAAPFQEMQSLPADASPADVNAKIDASNAALAAAGAADDKLSKDLDALLCGPRGCKHIKG